MIKALTIKEMAQLPYIERLGDLKTLSMFYDPADDQVILNSDHENYEIYNMLAASYLTADCDKRERLKTKIKSRFPEEIDLLEKVIQIRLKKELNNPERIKKQYKKEFKEPEERRCLYEHYNQGIL
ncbi:hypothetical protein [Anaerocolumna sp.]|uniref:hypothetical protein n=1 Tax=Anaerocolumna sp. TaxID=2041569 RepID=UPI0028AD163A|nr:hypothetical protein [Anaerocolumna sp.]